MHESEQLEQATVARRLSTPAPAERPDVVADLPTQLGNREFARLVAGDPIHRSTHPSQGAGPLDPEIEAGIRTAQGLGRPLDDGVRGEMEPHFGVDLSAVRVHADSGGDALSRSVQADAFTTGTDIFFRSGRYSPNSSDGRKLVAHELTHVIQQASGAVPAESRVSHPDDPHEVEARSVADAVVSASPVASTHSDGSGSTVHRQGMEASDEDELSVSRQEVTDDEDIETYNR